MVEYICKHQNSYVYTNLIEDNVIQMMQKEIKVCQLFASQLCIKEILYNEWPEKSFENEKCLVAYNQSKLCL